MYDGIRKISVEIMATEKWKNQGKCITRKMTKAEIEKYGISQGGKDMPRPKGSKNKPKANNDQKITLNQEKPKVVAEQSEKAKETAETIKAVTEARQSEYHKEEVLDKMFKDAGFQGLTEAKEIPEHINDFRTVIRMKQHAVYKHALRYKIDGELEKSEIETLNETVARIIDYCQEILNRIEKDL